jgi:hypothetical protein
MVRLKRLILALLTVVDGLQQVRVWDGCLNVAALRTIQSAGQARAHPLTTVYDRGEDSQQCGRTVIEQALCSLLDELGDGSRFVEYWLRDEWVSLEAHRDIDEELCRTVSLEDGFGLQRCPLHGHVLYVDLEEGVSGTCCWEEDDVDSPEPDDGAGGGDSVPDDLCAARGGAPRPLRGLIVVPAVQGRLLKFSGDMLHGVCRPALALLDGTAAVRPETSPARSPAPIEPFVLRSMRRCALLFNTWAEPPLTPLPNQPLTDRETAAAPGAPLTCLPRAVWTDVPVATATDSKAEGARGPLVRLSVPLLGDPCRRGTAAAEAVAIGSEPALREALSDTRQPTLVRLF